MNSRYIFSMLYCIIVLNALTGVHAGTTKGVDTDIRELLVEVRKNPPTAKNVRSIVDRFAELYDQKSAEFTYINFAYESLEARCINACKAKRPEEAAAYFVEQVDILETLLSDLDPREELTKFRQFPPNPSDTNFKYKGTTYHLYWGDFHVHSNKSYDARRAPSYSLQFARDVGYLDFVALSDHAWRFVDPVQDWKEIIQVSNAFNEPGTFVVFHGYEYGGRAAQGHQNVVFKNDHVPPVAYAWTDPQSNTVRRLWDVLRKYEVLTIPHHSAYALNGMGNNWIHYNPGMQPVVELLSTHGNSENMNTNRPYTRYGTAMDPGRTVQAALARGLRFGFIGGSDSHGGKPGYYDPDFSSPDDRPGLTGVFAPSLTRPSIFEAIQDRLCYATNGERIWLMVMLNGVRMGSEIVLGVEDDKVINIEVKGTDIIERIELVENNKVIYLKRPNAVDVHLEVNLKGDPLHIQESSQQSGSQSGTKRGSQLSNEQGAKIRLLNTSAKTVDFYYVRVIQRNGGRAWSSPIWVDYGIQGRVPLR